MTQAYEGPEQYLPAGEPAKSVTLIGAGPNGMTLRSFYLDTARAYLAARES